MTKKHIALIKTSDELMQELSNFGAPSSIVGEIISDLMKRKFSEVRELINLYKHTIKININITGKTWLTGDEEMAEWITSTARAFRMSNRRLATLLVNIYIIELKPKKQEKQGE